MGIMAKGFDAKLANRPFYSRDAMRDLFLFVQQ